MTDERNHEGLFPGVFGRIKMDYAKLLEATRTGDKGVDSFLIHLYEAMNLYDQSNPYERKPLKQLDDKVDLFLKRHAGVDYQTFSNNVSPEGLVDGDYAYLPQKRNLRRRLFNHRARLYISALEGCETDGLDICEIIRKIEEIEIPTFKGRSKEPTLEAIKRIISTPKS